MFSFRAYFWNNDVYINEKYKYAASEILTAYLNIEYISLAEDLRYDLMNMSPPFYTASRIDFTLAALKFDSCGAEV
ncbi:MAG: hypothetical protein PHH84_08000 [Oscillospiraceae bacterium]|nr:hypothetical protein [Oscillospiraceae bacterium]